MSLRNQVAREISYATSAQTRGGRALIRTVENATGRLRLIKRAAGYEHEVARGRDFWQVMVERYGLSLKVVDGDLASIPSAGPLVLLSNHPYGILDGLMLGHILRQVRGDFRILANRVFGKARDLDDVILPVSFDETRAAMETNLSTRKQALTYLGQGGAIGVFPGGTVSTASTPFGPPVDPRWRSFTAKMIARSDAVVVPVFFCGTNSRLFQLASHMHMTLRMALLINEFRLRVDEPVEIAIGRPIARDRLDGLSSDPRAMMDFLRQQTYALSPSPLETTSYGFEFEEKYKR